MRDVIASYEVLVNLFERIHLFLQRLNRYASIPLTPEMTELLAKIMAQILSILALSTRTMKERRISRCICLIYILSADYSVEKFMRKLTGKTETENAIQKLDVLTKEENLATAARNLEVTHRVDDKVTIIEEVLQEVVRDVGGDVKTTKELTHDIHADVNVIKESTQNVDDNVKVTKEGAFVLSISLYKY